MLPYRFLYWFDDISAIMSMPEGSRERRRKLKDLAQTLSPDIYEDWKKLNPGFHHEAPFIVTLSVLYVFLWILLPVMSVPDSILLAVMLPFTAGMILYTHHVTRAMRRHFLRWLDGFWRKLQSFSPERIAQIRALTDDPWQEFYEGNAAPECFTITCGCADCFNIFQVAPEPGEEFPDCTRCGSHAVIYASPGVPLNAEILKDIHDLICEEN